MKRTMLLPDPILVICIAAGPFAADALSVPASYATIQEAIGAKERSSGEIKSLFK